MNQLLFDRSTGAIGPSAFARLQTSQLVNALQPAPRLRFDGGEKEDVRIDEDVGSQTSGSQGTKIWAHQSGVNALSLDIEGRM